MKAYWDAPWANGNAISFGFPSSTTMRMIGGVHGKTPNSWADAEPPSSPSFAQGGVFVVDVAGHTNRCDSVLVDESNFTAGNSDGDIIRCLFELPQLIWRQAGHVHLSTAITNHFDHLFLHRVLTLSNDDPMCSGASTDLSNRILIRGDVENRSSNRYHAQSQTITFVSCLGSQNSLIYLPTHFLHQRLGKAWSVALDSIASSQTLGGKNIGPSPALQALHQCNVRGPTGIMFDAFDEMFTTFTPSKVNSPYPSLMPPTAVSDYDVACHISTTLAVSLLWMCERVPWSAFPQMFVQWPHQMSNAGCSRSIASESHFEFGRSNSLVRIGKRLFNRKING